MVTKRRKKTKGGGKVMNIFCRSKSCVVVSLMVGMLLLTAGSAFGAGFAIIEQSVSGLGNAFAGGSAIADDPTTVFFNPAGMTRLEGLQMDTGLHVIIPSVKFDNEGSTHVLQGVTGVPLKGRNGGDGGVARAVPNFYSTKKMSDNLSVGLGINAPFGLCTKYNSSWIGRYHAIKSDMMTININPSAAYEITDRLSVGAGFNIQYIEAKLSNAIDFGTLDAVGYFAPLGLAPGALGLVPQGSDGFVELVGDSWGVGYNLGLLYEFTKDTRFGVAYRSRIEHTLDGDADFSGVPSGIKGAPVFKDSGVEADVTLPDSLSVSLFHQISSKWQVMADFTWTNWDVFDELRVEFDNKNQPDSVTIEDWQDSYRYSVGVSYLPTDQWTLRAGAAYDMTSVPDKEHRTPRIPCSDRLWAALGVGYKESDTVSIDVAYAHLFINDPEINKNPTGEDAVRGGLKGTYDAGIDIVSAQVVLRF